MPSQQATLLFATATPGVSRRAVRAFAKILQEEIASGDAFECLITTSRELRRLNREFRNKDYPTDVLSFPRSARTRACRVGTHADACSLGEIAISFHHALQQAAAHGHTINQEIEILMLHGLLHLLGMDHQTDRGQMSRTERKWRLILGLPTGLIERARA
ncbi:MAG TPA: rRNA maturation RNase YbeY [Bryobacteraceae bacterium]|nr:rRNA maturation RNase YbeY [Bryobacteraceae bacterium]